MAFFKRGDAESSPRLVRPGVIAIVLAAVLLVIIVVALLVSAGRPSTPASAGATVTATPGATDAPQPSGAANTSGAASTSGATDPSGAPDPGTTAAATDPSDPTPVEAAPVPFDQVAEPVAGLQVAISGLAGIDGKADGIGEVAGPAVQFTVTATNTGGTPVSLATAVVDVTYGAERTPASQLGSSSTPLPTEVASGAAATGTYVFTVPADQRSLVRITLDYQVGTPVTVFEGTAP